MLLQTHKRSSSGIPTAESQSNTTRMIGDYLRERAKRRAGSLLERTYGGRPDPWGLFRDSGFLFVKGFPSFF
jgi:hypothetical protein